MAEIESLSEIRRRHIKQVLRATKGDLNRAAAILGLSREELMKHLERNGLLGKKPAS